MNFNERPLIQAKSKLAPIVLPSKRKSKFKTLIKRLFMDLFIDKCLLFYFCVIIDSNICSGISLGPSTSRANSNSPHPSSIKWGKSPLK